MTPKNKFEAAATHAGVNFEYYKEGRKATGIKLVAPEGLVFLKGAKEHIVDRTDDMDTKALYDTARDCLGLLHSEELVRLRKEEQKQAAESELRETLRDRCGTLGVFREFIEDGNEVHIQLTTPVGRKFKNGMHILCTQQHPKSHIVEVLLEAVDFINAHVNKPLDKCECSDCYVKLLKLENSKVDPCTSLEMQVVGDFIQAGQSSEMQVDLSSESYATLNRNVSRVAQSLMAVPRLGGSTPFTNERRAHAHYFDGESDMFLVELDPFEMVGKFFHVYNEDLEHADFIEMNIDDVKASYKLALGWEIKSIGAVKQRYAL